MPENLNHIPPISFQLFSKPMLKRNPIKIGMCASQAIDQFLAPAILETEWNRLQKESPVHSGNLKKIVFVQFCI